MSIWAVNWALHAEVPNATHKLVLIALANFADDQDQAWPHVDTLAELASTSRRTVFRALEALEADELISRSMGLASGAHGGGQRQVNSLFRMHLPDTVSRRHVRGSARPDQLRESRSEIRCDTGGTPDLRTGEGPSGIRCDVDGTAEIRCDTGDTSGVTPVSPPYKEEPSGLTTSPTPLPPHHQPSQSSGRSGRRMPSTTATTPTATRPTARRADLRPKTGRSQAVVATDGFGGFESSSSRAAAGVIPPRVLRGRWLSSVATAMRRSALWALRLVPFGKYWRSSPFVFSLLPRCQGECGSQK